LRHTSHTWLIDSHKQRTNRSQTAKRLQTSNIFCIVGELHDDNTCVPNLRGSHMSNISHMLQVARVTYHGIRDALLQQLDHSVLTLTRALQQQHYKSHSTCRVMFNAPA
jgi:hypothetical protein